MKSDKKEKTVSNNKIILLKKNTISNEDTELINKLISRQKIFTVETISNSTNISCSSIKKYIHSLYLLKKVNLIIVSSNKKNYIII